MNPGLLESYQSLPKCACGDPATIKDKLGLRCAPCELVRLKPEIDALNRERDLAAAREAILNPPKPERDYDMALDDQLTIERNKKLLDKFRKRKQEQALQELEEAYSAAA